MTSYTIKHKHEFVSVSHEMLNDLKCQTIKSMMVSAGLKDKDDPKNKGTGDFSWKGPNKAEDLIQVFMNWLRQHIEPDEPEKVTIIKNRSQSPPARARSASRLLVRVDSPERRPPPVVPETPRPDRTTEKTECEKRLRTKSVTNEVLRMLCVYAGLAYRTADTKATLIRMLTERSKMPTVEDISRAVQEVQVEALIVSGLKQMNLEEKLQLSRQVTPDRV